MSADDSNLNANPKGSHSPETTPRAPSCPAETPEPQPQQQPPAQPQRHPQHQTQDSQPNAESPRPQTSRGSSPPARKDTVSSTSTSSSVNHAVASVPTEGAHVGGAANPDQGPLSPVQSQGQTIFSARDGAEVSNNRRASRRRTGPLSQQQREKAALIRKLGACHDCRRRRVACHPSHHNMTWEEAMRKYRQSSPGMPEIAPMTRPLSPAPVQINHSRSEAHGDEMEIDSPPGFIAPRATNAASRTPLPSGPSMKRPTSSTGSVIEPLQADLQAAANKISRSPYRSRYAQVSALMLCWEGDEYGDVFRALGELSTVLRKSYRYEVSIKTILEASAETNPWRWMMTTINNFMGENDRRDVLKIIVYNGHSYLDSNREMVLASAGEKSKASTIRWSGIQQVLEEACSDTLVLMDSAYHPSTKTVRRRGILEFIAAVSCEDHLARLGRTGFTKTLTKLLQTRATQPHATPFTAAELHARLHSEYPGLIGDIDPQREILTSYPSPVHMQVADNTTLPSILVAPIYPSPQRIVMGAEPQLTLSFKLADASIDYDAWVEWIRTMPGDVREVKVDGPTRPLR